MMRRRVFLAAVLATLVASPAAAQRPGLVIQLPSAARVTQDGPVVHARNVLTDARMRELLEAGFPARLRYRVELWSDERFTDELHRTAEWEVLVRWRGTDQRYEVSQRVGSRVLSLGSFQQIDDAEAAVERPLRVPIAAPARNRRYYYQATLEVRTLSVSDLAEVNAWLRGELTPAMRGQGNPGTALTRGLRSLTTRLLGGERREYSARSGVFRPPR